MQGYKKGANISDVYKIRSLNNTLSVEDISRTLKIEIEVVQSHVNGIGSNGFAKKKRGRPSKSEVVGGVVANEG